MTFITAEIGINHNGSIEIAKKLIDVASSAGCDAVKFQKRNVEKVYSKKVLDTYRESMWGTTTREQKLGLEFSEKQYTSLNCSFNLGDKKEKVMKNIELTKKILNLSYKKIKFLNQIHSTNVELINNQNFITNICADGSITIDKNITDI